MNTQPHDPACHHEAAAVLLRVLHLRRMLGGAHVHIAWIAPALKNWRGRACAGDCGDDDRLRPLPAPCPITSVPFFLPNSFAMPYQA